MWAERVFIMIKYIAGPLIGMVIGYCTNYIAVKMLFLPREEKYLFGHKLPLTPGAIPKGKNRLAKAAGTVVSETLITENDISEKLLTKEMEDGLVDSVMEVVKTPIEETLASATSEEQATVFRIGIDNMVTGKVVDAISNYDYETLIKTQGMRAIKEKISGSMISMFVSDDMINGILDSVVMWLRAYINDGATAAIRPLVSNALSDIFESSPESLAEAAGYDEDVIRDFVRELYRKAATQGVRKALEHIDIASVVEEKINAMSVEELEKLVLDVMKSELNMIVNLGALIGFVLGLLNIFI